MQVLPPKKLRCAWAKRSPNSWWTWSSQAPSPPLSQRSPSSFRNNSTRLVLGLVSTEDTGPLLLWRCTLKWSQLRIGGRHLKYFCMLYLFFTIVKILLILYRYNWLLQRRMIHWWLALEIRYFFYILRLTPAKTTTRYLLRLLLIYILFYLLVGTYKMC